MRTVRKIQKIQKRWRCLQIMKVTKGVIIKQRLILEQNRGTWGKVLCKHEGTHNKKIGKLHIVEHKKNFMYPIVAITNQCKMTVY